MPQCSPTEMSLIKILVFLIKPGIKPSLLPQNRQATARKTNKTPAKTLTAISIHKTIGTYLHLNHPLRLKEFS